MVVLHRFYCIKIVCFQLLCKDKEQRPPDSVVHKILIESDISLKNESGQTLLFKAIACDYSEQFIRALFKYGIDIATRDRKGRTAHDYAEVLKKTKYFEILDDYVISLVKEGRVDLLEELLLQGYDHILDITDGRGFNIFQIINENSIPSKEEVLKFLGKIPSVQVIFITFDLTKRPRRIYDYNPAFLFNIFYKSHISFKRILDFFLQNMALDFLSHTPPKKKIKKCRHL